jgi:Zn-dependent metalloprotease
MKKIILSALAIGFYVFSFAQSKTIDPKITIDKNGIIQSVEFPDSIDKSKIPSSSIEFINKFIKPTENEYFKLEPSKVKKKDFRNEHYDQYFKAIKVEGAGYNFHYKNGKLFYAHGNYIKIENLSVTPSITEERAKDCFIEYKNIPIDSVTGYISELLIKNVSDEQNPLPQLVYKIYLHANHENNNEVGYIDAHSCKVLLTEPSLLDWAATGTFATRYSGARQAITQNYTGAFHLADSTRGAIIHTWNLNGSTNIQNRIELSDNDNNWTAAEHSANENDMGLDVHWALQQIYDRLNNVHGINSFNNNGFAIDAHIRYGTFDSDRDNAAWNPTLNHLVFGDGAVKFRPVACIDAVAHEFGHGITDFQIGWGVTGDPRAFHEGLSDIWGVILESRIRPNSTWQIGEQITLNHACLRNIQNTNDPNAMQPIANTFGSSQYNSGDSYVRSGVFSHWFYLLVNGGSGTNDVGNVYTVYGMGMDVAEDLIVEAVFNNFLDNTTTYAGIRTGMINAATAMCGANSLLVRQVENAWYAVGVGAQSSQASLSGASSVCASGTNFTVNNLPTGCTINWSYSANLQSYGSGSNYISLRAIGSGSGWVRATLNSGCGQITLPQKNVHVGITASFTGSSSVLYLKTGTWTGSASCGTAPYNYDWFLRKDGTGMGAVLVATGNPLTLKSVKAGISYLSTEMVSDPIINQPITQTIFYLYARAFDANGNVYITPEKRIVAYGNVDLVPAYMPYMQKSALLNENQELNQPDTYLEVFPNPVSDNLTINIVSSDEEKSDNNVSITIFDSYMSKIKVFNTNSKENILNISDLRNGIYIVQVQYGENQWTEKILVE